MPNHRGAKNTSVGPGRGYGYFSMFLVAVVGLLMILAMEEERKREMDSEKAMPIVEVEAREIKTLDAQGGSVEDITHLVEHMEMATNAMKAIIPQLLKVCSSKDIVDFGGKPYLCDSAAQKIGRIINVGYEEPKIDAYWDNSNSGEVYIVMISGCVIWREQRVPIEGGSSSDDPFLKKRKCGRAEKMLAVRKKALANWRGSGIRALFGFNSLTWKDLEALGYSQNQSATVNFKSKKDSKKSSDPTPAEGNTAKVKLGNQIMFDCGKDPEKCKEVLRRLTTFEGDRGIVQGKESVKDMTDKHANVVWGKVKPKGNGREEYEEILKDVVYEQLPEALR